MIDLVLGSIFDSKCDLLVLPCDNSGRVSKKIKEEVLFYQLPFPTDDMQPGDVWFCDTPQLSNSPVIAYAASIDDDGQTDRLYLELIAHRIKHFCLDNSAIKVNLPLLGTGKGQLSPVNSYQIFSDAFEKSPDITACIHVISDTFFDQISANFAVKHGNEISIQNPRVFISYTAIDSKNATWVKKFARQLRNNGIDARVDFFHLKPGQDLPQWMTNELLLADKVLLICDEYYAEKANNRRGGVGWESMIIQGDMLMNQNNEKYIAIVRDKNINKSLPIYVRSKFALNWADYNEGEIPEDVFKSLLLLLYDCNTVPPIGPIPDYIRNKL